MLLLFLLTSFLTYFNLEKQSYTFLLILLSFLSQNPHHFHSDQIFKGIDRKVKTYRQMVPTHAVAQKLEEE